MTDELQTARLAISIGQTLSPVPQIHGEYYAALSQLYPLLLSPLYGFLSTPDAFRAAHVLNAFLLASAAWPAYLLARDLTGSRAAGYLAAGFTAFTPWLALGATLLTENAAYAAFVWSVLLVYRTLVEPSDGRDAAAVAALLLAFFARTQLVVLALALPVALVAHELAFATARAQHGSRLRAARSAISHLVSVHRLLACVYGAGAAGAAALAAAGSLGTVVGNYGETFSSPLLPTGIWSAAAVHFAHVVVAGGVLPFLIGMSWAVVSVVRPERKRAHAFAVLLIVLVTLLTFEAASFDLRFTPGAFVQDRYLCYAAPLLAVAAAAGLVETAARATRAALLAAAAVLFTWLAGFASFDGDSVIFWASPASAFHPALASAADAVGVTPTTFVRIATLTVASVAAVAVWRGPTRTVAGVCGSALIAFGAFQALYVLHRHARPAATRPSAIVVPAPDWIDATDDRNGPVAIVPTPYLGPGVWWDAEFWNKSVTHTLRVDAGPAYTPFPAADVTLDFARGAIGGEQPAELLLLAVNETRLHLAERERLRELYPLRLVRVERPYRAEWATRGADADGWTRPGKTVTLRFYPGGKPRPRTVSVTLSAPESAAVPLAYTLRAGDDVYEGVVEPGHFRRVRFVICTAVGASADATLVARGAVPLPDGRVASLHVDRIETTSGGSCA